MGAAPHGLDVPPRGLQEERQSHTALPGSFLVHWPISSSSTAVLSPFSLSQQVPWGHRMALGGSGVQQWGFSPLSAHSCTPCLRCISCVSKPPSCPRNSHNLLCVFLAQKRLIHSVKQINYFCYLEKKKKREKSFKIGRLNFQLCAQCSEANLL